MNILFLIVVIFLKKTHTLDICESQKTCKECIMQSYDCIWCNMDNVTDRCKSKKTDLTTWCLNERISPPNEWSIKENGNFSSVRDHVIQIRPQKISINLRPGHPLHFNFSYKNAQDYPVDLYFLIDGTESMKPIKDKTANQSENIFKMMKTMTSNVSIGMGTFVDKNALPFTNIQNSTVTYSFKNHLKLTDKFEVFKKIVNDIPFGYNYDVPDGQLDALAQVIVCKDEIDWRNESRKIIIVLTGAPYHAAGDGQWAGIIKPNDGKCYTNNGVYTKELEMDYPSVSLINKLASDEQITIIFAVTKDRDKIYKSLSNSVSGSRMIIYDTEENDDEIVKILQSIYKEITSTLKMKVNMKWAYQNFFKISTNPDCISSNNNQECRLKQGEEKIITGKIELLQNINGVDNIPIDLVVEGIKDKLNLNINLLKTCNCDTEVNSATCSGQGTKICGICECNEGKWGDKCQCSSNNSTSIYDTAICKAPNSTKDCSGHGFCKCGTCLCRDRFEGRYCECSKDSCPRGENHALCSDQGVCQCGKCKCGDGWTGNACDCLNSTAPCYNGDKICNDRGECNCGKCECDPIAKWDARGEQDKRCTVTCDSNPSSCHTSQCNILEPCALCSHIHNSTDSTCSDCNGFHVTIVKNITEGSWSICPDIPVNAGCDMTFGYRYATDRYGIDVVVQSVTDCAKTYYMVGGGVIGIIVAVGIATTLLWKLITYIQDKREYEKFLNEVANIDEKCDNPFYKPASSSFNNPALRKRSIF